RSPLPPRGGGAGGGGHPADWPADVPPTLEIPAPGGDLRGGARLHAFPDFGLYVYRSDRLFLAVRCGRRGQIATDGHAHVDELSVELSIDGEDVLADPGTYLYTALPERRDEYRSARAHFVPRALASGEAARFARGLFELRDAPVGRCVYWGPRGFGGVVEVGGTRVVRTVSVEADRVVVGDSGDGTTCAPAAFSPGYGKRERPGPAD
ncbi:MAG TPA: heparinase II/III family protein, partial [Longimicrobiaceae bacterium]